MTYEEQQAALKAQMSPGQLRAYNTALQNYGSDYAILDFGNGVAGGTAGLDPGTYYGKNDQGQYFDRRTGGIITNKENIRMLSEAGVGGGWFPNQTDYKSGVIPQADLALGAKYVAPPPGESKPAPASGVTAAERQAVQNPDQSPAKTRIVNGQRIDLSTGLPYVDTMSSMLTPDQANSQNQSLPTSNVSQRYTVRPGDTLSGIARQYGVGINDITGYRSGNPNLIYPGENLTIGGGSPTPEGAGGLGSGGTNSQTNSGFVDSTTGTGLGGQAPAPVPPKDFVQMYGDIIKSLGLTDIKKAFQDATKEQQKIQDELAGKIADINENPWLTEGVRVNSIEKLKERYATKLDIAQNKIQIYDSLYKEGTQQAQFLATGEYNQQQDAAALAEKKLEAQQALTQLDPSAYKEVQGGLYDLKNQTWLVPPPAPQISGTPSGSSGGSVGGSVGGKLLTINEAEALGVPYGTTQQGAFGMQPLSTSARTTLNQISNSIPLIDTLGSLVDGLQLANDSFSATGRGTILSAQSLVPSTLAGQYKAQSNAFVSLITRALGEKGTLAEGDVARIKAALPGFYDTDTSAANKLNNLRQIMTDVYNRSKSGYYDNSNSFISPSAGITSDPLGIL